MLEKSSLHVGFIRLFHKFSCSRKVHSVTFCLSLHWISRWVWFCSSLSYKFFVSLERSLLLPHVLASTFTHMWHHQLHKIFFKILGQVNSSRWMYSTETPSKHQNTKQNVTLKNMTFCYRNLRICTFSPPPSPSPWKIKD